MALRIIIGIDPGVKGAIAVLIDRDPILVMDMPTVPNAQGKRTVDPYGLSRFIGELQAKNMGSHIFAVCEAPSMRPENARGSDTKSAEGVGMIKGVLAAHGIGYTQVYPQSWKRYFGLLGTTKEASRELALQTWPAFHKELKRKKDHDRAEAMLVALWGNDTECWIDKLVIARRTARTSCRSN